MKSPMEEQTILNRHLEDFKKENPRLVEAMQILNIDMEQYFQILNQMNHPSSSSTNTTSGG